VLKGDASALKLKGGYFEITTSNEGTDRDTFIRDSLRHWYNDHAAIRLKEKTNRFAKIIGVKPKSVTVKDYKTRWGSCSSKGDVSFNWRIIMTPHQIIDYVVIHELCHLLEHNHSPKYWRLLERHIPDYLEKRDWLKVQGSSYNIL